MAIEDNKIKLNSVTENETVVPVIIELWNCLLVVANDTKSEGPYHF